MSMKQLLMGRVPGPRLAPVQYSAPPPAPGLDARSLDKYGASLNADVLDKQHGPADPERAAAALLHLTAPGDRDAWRDLVWAYRDAGGDLKTAERWSAAGENFSSNDAVRLVWKSFKPGGVGAGTLFMKAHLAGWQDTRGGGAIASGTTGAGTQVANDPSDGGHEQATDLWLGGYFTRRCASEFRYVHNIKQWRTYSAGSWSACRKGEHIEAMKRLAGALMQECGKLLVSNPAGRDIKKLMACAQRAQSVQGIEAALKLAQSDPAIATSSDEFDTDPDLLNVANGIVHLPTGLLMPHDPAQMTFRQVPAPFDANAACPELLKFMDEVSCGDPDWVEFMQRALGYSLSGHVIEEKLFFWLGKGANGKSVLANIVRHIIGTYGVTVPPAFMMQSRRDGGSATPELAMLPGARMAFANEIEAGSRLSGATVKNAVSTEDMTVRPLYCSPFTFKPTHKLLIRGNHRPIVTDDDEGIWRRILLIPFDLNVAPQDRDPGLEARLIAEAPGILRWMVEGFVKWRQSGLKVAKRVTDASLAYRRESDLLEQWLSERCERGSAHTTQQRHAYGSYRRWCDEQGLRCFAKASFTRSLIERGIGTGREGSGERRETYTGLRLTHV